MFRPDDQIAFEIKTLLETKPRIPPLNDYRDSNHDAIDAQLKVLSDRMTYMEVVHEWGGTVMDENTLDAAHYARDWMEMEPVQSPSSDWLNDYAGKLLA